MKIVKFVLIDLIFLMVIACNKNEKRVRIEQIITEWKGKEVYVPDNYRCNFLGYDTTQQPCHMLFGSEYRVLLYVDSTGCSECRLKLFEWKRLIAESDSLFGEKLSFLSFFQPKNKKEISYMLKRDRFDYPVFIDENNQINSLNHFPDKPELQCFLLDKNNKVLLIGNPVLNPKIWELYKPTITGKKDSDNQPVMTVAVTPEELEIMDLSVGKKELRIF